jgi:hypothetical protein
LLRSIGTRLLPDKQEFEDAISSGRILFHPHSERMAFTGKRSQVAFMEKVGGKVVSALDYVAFTDLLF